MRFLFLFVFLSLFYFPAFAACINPDGVPGELMYNSTYNMFQGCTRRGWMGFHAPLPTQDCPNIGDVCASGIIYAGEYAGHKLYVTGEDAPVTYPWNDGSTNWLDLDNTFMPDCPPRLPPRVVNGVNRYSDQSNPACMGAQGPAFTDYLADFTGTGSPYKAASYCYHLGKASDPTGANNPLAHGRDDWYLPAVDELEFIYDNLGPQPNHSFRSSYYWSSTEVGNNTAWTQLFNDGLQNYYNKSYGHRVRCVRR